MAATNQTDQKILDAMAQLLLETGYQGATTHRIAEVAGVNESTVFRHFSDKKHILNRLIEDYLTDIRTVAQDFQFQDDVVTDLQNVARLYAKLSTAHKGIFLTGVRDSHMFPEVGEAVSQLLAELKTIFLTRFPELIARGEVREDINIEVESMNFISMLFGNMVFLYAYPSDSMGIPANQFVTENVRDFALKLRPS